MVFYEKGRERVVSDTTIHVVGVGGGENGVREK